MYEIIELYGKIKMGKATAAEKQRFMYLLAMPANEAIARELIDDYIAIASEMDSIPSAAPQRLEMISESILTATSAPALERSLSKPVHRVHLLRTAWFRYAAIFLIAASLIAVLLVTTSDPAEPVAVVSQRDADILPGTDRAILTLSTGEKVELNKLASDTIFDGQLAITNRNGELLYGKTLENRANTMTTPKGCQYKLTLADGTRVWLNAASSITYPTSFEGDLREIKITGEAFLEVAKDAQRPFKINIGEKANIQVLGTSINVNAYAEESGITTTLIDGAIRVNDLNSRQTALLQPGEQAQISAGTARNLTRKKADIEKVLAWKNGLFNFQGDDLETVMRQLSRWYDVDIIFQGERPSRYFEGKMDRGLTLSQVLKILKETGINFTIDGRKLIVSK